MISDTLEPIYVRFEHAFSALMRPGQYVKFNPDAMKRVDLMTRYKSHSIGISAGFLAPSEAREIEDLGEAPDDLQPPRPNNQNYLGDNPNDNGN